MLQRTRVYKWMGDLAAHKEESEDNLENKNEAAGKQ